MREEYGVYVGDYVTVGHSVTLHGCKIEDRCLIGMGSIILNGAVVGSGSIIAAGTLIPEKTIIEPNSLWMGSPGKLRRQLEEKDQETILRYAENYLGYKESYLNGEKQLAQKSSVGPSIASRDQPNTEPAEHCMIKSPRGTRDLLPPDTALWNFVEAAVRDVFRAYNFQEIRTPIFESTELFARGVGEETDIVAKEMYTWEDRGRAESDKGQSLTLRPENTAGVVRAYIEHKLWERGLNKLYYIGPQFRRERPQKGRYRPVLPDRRGSHRAGNRRQRISRARRRNSRNARDLARPSRHHRLDARTQFSRLRRTIALRSTRPCALRWNRSRQKCAPTASAAPSPTRCASSTAKSPKTSPSSRSLPRISQFLDEPCREHFEEVQQILNIRRRPLHPERPPGTGPRLLHPHGV